MDLYEEMIRDRLNQTAGKDVWFNVKEIMDLPETTINAVICELLGYACSSTNIMPITIGRKCLQAFPSEFITEKIKMLALSAIDINDYWDYRRLLEVAELISEDLLIWAVSLGEGSDDYDIAEAHNDFKLRLLINKFKNSKTLDRNEISELITVLNKSAEYDGWDYTIDCLDAEIIDKYLFDYLYKNKICLDVN